MRDDFGNQKTTGAPAAPQTQLYTTPSEPALDSGKVIAIAGGAAGAVAGLWVLLSEREKKQVPKSTMDQMRAIVDEALERARSEGVKAEVSFAAGLRGGKANNKKSGKKAKTSRKKAKTSRKKGKKTGKLAIRSGKRAEADRAEVVDRLTSLLRSARQDVAKTYGDDVSKRVQLLREEAQHSLEEGRKRSKAYSELAKKDAERARKEAATLAGALKARAIEAEHQAEHYVDGVVKPLVKDWSEEAHHLVEAGKERTEKLRKRAEKELVPDAKKRAEGLRKKAGSDLLPEARKAAENLTHNFEETKKAAKKSLGSGSAGAAMKLGEAVHVVEEQASEAGEAVKRGGRETRSLLLWVALAGVLIFTVFLDEDQQKRLKEIAFEIFGEAKDMYNDMKGEGSSTSI